MDKNKFTGLIVEAPLPSDYKVGGYTGIIPEVRATDWSSCLTTGEVQYGPTGVSNYTFDTLSCASYATLHAIETQINYLLLTNRVSTYQRQILANNGFIENTSSNTCKLSARFLAITSNTTKEGNTVSNVSNTARIVGCIPNKDLPFGGKSFEEYHNPLLITKEMKEKGQIFLEIFSIKYEWVFFNEGKDFSDLDRANTEKAILQAPLLIGVPITAGHLMMLYKLDATTFSVLDQYTPLVSQRNISDLTVHFAFKVLVEMQKPFTFDVRLTFDMRHPDVAVLQRVLNRDYTTRVADTGPGSKGQESVYFGKMTRAAVMKFQAKYLIPTVGDVGPLTRSYLNKIIAGESPVPKPTVVDKFNLKPIVKKAALAIISRCEDLKIPIRITEGYRSNIRQQELYNKGRVTAGTIVTNAKPGWSFHNYGIAFDICFTSEEPYKGREGDFKKVADIAKEYGLEWGGNWDNNLNDIPHFQFTGGYLIADFANNKIDWSMFEVK